MRGDVARAAGIGVEPPGAADVRAPLENDEVVVSLLAQADRHAEAGEARADDGHVDLVGDFGARAAVARSDLAVH